LRTGVLGCEGYVFEVGVEGDGHGRGDGPWGRGPYDGVDFAAGERFVEVLGRGGHPVPDIYGWAGVLLVLNLGFGEGGAIVNAPVDGLESAVDEALLKEAVEGFKSAGFVVAGHGHVGFFPAAEAPDALKL
jgi:hypothetical protein